VDEPRHDIVLRGGTVYDGTGRAGTVADVAVHGDRIAAVAVGLGPGRTEVDVSGLAVSPGFIDVHAHDDFAVLLEPELPFKLLQGVTTVVVGNCGSGVVPFEAGLTRFRRFHPAANPRPWRGFGEYLARVDEVRPAVNVGVLMGHGSLRRGAMGLVARPPREVELQQMRAWVQEGIEAGALGLSSGLFYEPGCHARADELVALAREMARTGGVYTSHIRDEGPGLLDSIQEAIGIGRAAQVPVQISHHKASGRSNWGRVRESLQVIGAARGEGLDVTADQYPYTAASTTLYALVQSGLGRTNSGGLGDFSATDIAIASAPQHAAYEGQTLAGLAAGWGMTPDEAAARLVAEEGEACVVIVFSMSEADVRTVLAHPTTMIGSDGVPAAGSKPHPRLYGCFARILGHYVRETGVLDLATALHRMTGMPAGKFGLQDRGILRPGGYADLVVFDPARIRDGATYETPRQFPEGVSCVFVNGELAARDGRGTGRRAGRALRRRA
jgi:N-acyl-D-amino-acid deacylase